MDTLPAGKPVLELIELCYQANRPILLSGHHGVGKSELLQQAADDLGIGFVCRDLSLMEPPDLTGLPRIEGSRTAYSPPKFLPQKGQGLLVFEELNRCERYVRVPCLQLLTTRTLNDYHLPDGWLPVAAVNPADSGYEVAELDVALVSRFVQVHVVPDRDHWLNWARRNEIHPSVISYVASDETVFDTPESSPRSWAYVSVVLKIAAQQRTADQTLRAAVLGLLGDTRGSAFLRTLKQADVPLTATAILHSYRVHRANLQRWVEHGRLDLVEASLRALLTALQPRADYIEVREAPDWWENLSLFLADLPRDQRQTAESFFRERDYAMPELEEVQP
jgi:MoxR-like ATPase